MSNKALKKLARSANTDEDFKLLCQELKRHGYGPASEPQLHPDGKKIYTDGYKDGLYAFAHWKDGVQYVGTCGTLLNEVLDNPERVFNFNPPGEE